MTLAAVGAGQIISGQIISGQIITGQVITGRFIASLPSPSSGTVKIGPLNIHAYGLMIAIGVVAAVWLMGRRFEEKGIGTRDDANGMAVWAVLAGVIGSRLYHVATDWSKFEDNLGDIPKIWQGGLGIPGGLAAGIPVGLYYLKRKGIPVGLAANCGAPAIALAQAIGRWGNYFNQELFGRPTTLPWGLEIDADRAPEYPPGTLFHPTFLYESLSNFALAGILLLIDRRFRVRPGHLMAMYLMGYGVIRFFVEGLRIDKATEVGGLRWNQWVALAMVVGGGAYLLISTRYSEPLEVTTDDAELETLDDDVELEALDETEPADETNEVVTAAADETVDPDGIEVDPVEAEDKPGHPLV